MKMQFCKSLFILELAIYITSFCYLRETSCLHSLLLNNGCDSDVHSHKEAKEELGFVLNFINPVFLFFQESMSKDINSLSANHVKNLHSSLLFCLLSEQTGCCYTERYLILDSLQKITLVAWNDHFLSCGYLFMIPYV